MLNDDVLLCIKSFVMKPRHFYAHIHGEKPKHAAFELCLLLIASDSQSTMLLIINLMKKFGVQLPNNHNQIYEKFWTTFEIKNADWISTFVQPRWISAPPPHYSSFKEKVIQEYGTCYVMKVTDLEEHP